MDPTDPARPRPALDEAAPTDRQPVVRAATGFVLLALALSWVPLTLLLVTTADPTAGPLSFVLWALGGLGPALAAIVMARITYGKAGVRALLRRLLRWRMGRWTWLLLAPLPVGLIAVLSVVGTGRASLATGGTGFLVLVPIMLVGGVLFGGLEEIGWRGYLQPRLQATIAPAAAAVVVGLVWAVWHAPLFLLAGTTQAEGSVLWFTLGAVALSIVFAWAYNASGGNLLLVVLLHGALNGWYSAVVQGLAPDVLGAGFEVVTAMAATVIAGVLFWRSGPELGRRPRPATPR